MRITKLLFFMCLFLEMLFLEKCRNLSGEKYFPITLNIFPIPKIWDYFLFLVAFVDRVIRGNI